MRWVLHVTCVLAHCSSSVSKISGTGSRHTSACNYLLLQYGTKVHRCIYSKTGKREWDTCNRAICTELHLLRCAFLDGRKGVRASARKWVPFWCYNLGVPKLLVSLGHIRWRRVILGHMLNTQTLMKTDDQKKNLLNLRFCVGPHL